MVNPTSFELMNMCFILKDHVFTVAQFIFNN